MPNARSVTFHR